MSAYKETLATKQLADKLEQIVKGLAEGVILIGADRRLIWVNQAALELHGVAAAAALGQTIDAYQQRFQLSYRNHQRVAPHRHPMERALDGECFQDLVVEVRPVGDTEQSWVHKVRNLPLAGEQDLPGASALMLTDASDWLSAEQRFEKTFNANPAPAVICHLGDLRYVKVNQGFCDMTGYARDEVLDRSVYELDVLEQGEQRELAIERLRAGETIPQMQAELRMADGSRKLVVVAGQPIEMNDQDCMLFTFIDLEPRRQVEQALRQSEQRFATVFRSSPAPTLVCQADDFKVLEINGAFAQATGYADEALLGQALGELKLWESRQSWQRLAARLQRERRLQAEDVRLQTADGRSIDCLMAAEAIQLQDQQGYLLTWLDITARKRSELELVDAIEAVMKDASWFSQTLIEKLANARRVGGRALGGELADLTSRERDVLQWICEGLSDKEIAERLAISTNTVRNHVASLYAKLDLHSRSEAIIWARERGIFARGSRRSSGAD